MRSVFKYLFYLLIIDVLLVVCFVLFAGPIISPYVQKQVISRLNETNLGQFNMRKLHISSIVPLHIQIHDFSLAIKDIAFVIDAQIDIKNINLKISNQDIFSKGFKSFVVDLKIDTPIVKMNIMKGGGVAPEPAPASATKAVSGLSKYSMKLDFSLLNGGVQLQEAGAGLVDFENLKIVTSGIDMLLSNIAKKLFISTQLVLPMSPAKIPLSLNADKIVLNSEKIASDNISVDIAGLLLQLAGATDLTQDVSQWKASVALPDISAMQVPPAFLPPGKWLGGIIGGLEFSQQAKLINVSGNLESKNLRGDIAYDSPDISAKGEFAPSISATFKYGSVQPALKIENLLIDTDFTNLQLRVKDLFIKPKGIPMTLSLDGIGDMKTFTMQNFLLQFNKLIVKAKGSVGLAPKSTSQIQVDLSETDLSGLENFLLPLKEFPLQGKLAFSGLVSGDIFDPNHISVKIANFSMENLMGGIKYLSEDKTLSLNGSVTANLRGNAHVFQQRLELINLRGQVDLSGFAISKKDVFYKNKGDALKLKLNISQGGSQIILNEVSLLSDFSNLNISGDIKSRNIAGDINNPGSSDINIKAKINSLDLTRLSKKMPEVKALGLSGFVSGELKALGQLDMKLGIAESPIALTGNLDVNLLKYTIAASPTPAVLAPAGDNVQSKNLFDLQNELPESQPLLPSWPVMRYSKLNLVVTLGELQYDQLKIKGIRTIANYDKGNIKGQAEVKSVMGGSLNVRSYDAKGLFVKPHFAMAMTASQIQLVPVVQFLTPEYLQYLTRGEISTDIKLTTPMPQTKNWLKLLTASGVLKGSDITTKEDIITKALGDKLSKMAKDKNVISKTDKPISLTLDSQFSLQSAVADFKSFNVKTLDDNEFDGRGSVDLLFNANLAGTLYLSKTDIGGSLRAANSDSKGRLVVPLAIKGPLFAPKFDIAEHTLEAMGKNVLKYESKKLSQDMKQVFKESGKEGVKKKLKGLFK